MFSKKTYKCEACGETVTHRNIMGKFCSNLCQNNLDLARRVEAGTASARTLKRFLIKTHGSKCQVCGVQGWMGKPLVMDLEHMDGDPYNNSLSNLSLICPNCHSQTPTYKGANRGSGRHSRRSRYASGKSY